MGYAAEGVSDIGAGAVNLLIVPAQQVVHGPEADYAALQGLRIVGDLGFKTPESIANVSRAAGGEAIITIATAGAGVGVRGFQATSKAPQSRVLWSGGKPARDAAESWARANKAVTLEMTPAGARLAAKTQTLNWQEARPLWINASREFARGASGKVHVFHNAQGVSLRSVWREVEYPILTNSPSVDKIVYHIVASDGTIDIVPK